MKSKFLENFLSFIKEPIGDRKALIILFIVFIVLVLPIFAKPISYIPAFRFYFEGLGEYYAPYYHPDKTHTFFSEIDSFEYYAYLPSMVIDRDFDFANQFQFLKWNFPISEKGTIINEFSIGPAMFWLPFFILGHIVSWLVNAFGIVVPLNGYSLFYELPCYFASVFYGFLGILLTYRMCREFFSSQNSFFSTIFLWLATPLIFYMEFEPSMSHAVSFFAATACIYVYFKRFNNRTLGSWALIGLLGGLTTLVRWQCASLIFFILLVDFIHILNRSIKESNPDLFKTNMIGWVICGLTSLAAFTPQIIAWFGFLASAKEIPQFSRGIMSYVFPAIYQTLFSSFHGFFSWTPIAIPALAGFWFFLKKRYSPTALIILLFFLSQVYFIGASDWTSGQGFGQRRLIETFIILALGMGYILEYFENNRLYYKIAVSVGFFFVWWNSVFIYQWIFGYIPKGNYVSFAGMTYDKFWVFFLMIQRAFVPITGLFNIW